LFDRSVYPETVDAVIDRHERRPPIRWVWLTPVPILAALALVVFHRPGPRPGYLGERGAVLPFQVLVAGPDGATALSEGAQVPAGTALRFDVSPVRPCWMMVVSLDHSGQVSKLFPADTDSAWVTSGGALPGGARLDGEAGPERFFGLCAPSRLAFRDVARVLQGQHPAGDAAVRDTHVLNGLAADVLQSTVLLEKQR
jgi:hypothetical protein